MFTLIYGEDYQEINAKTTEEAIAKAYMLPNITIDADAVLEDDFGNVVAIGTSEGDLVIPYAKRICFFRERGGDSWLNVFASYDEAESYADNEWRHSTENEKRNYSAFYIGIHNVDESGTYAPRGNGYLDADCYELIKDYLA